MTRALWCAAVAVLPLLAMLLGLAAVRSDLDDAQRDTLAVLIQNQWPLAILIACAVGALAAALVWKYGAGYGPVALRMGDDVELVLGGQHGRAIAPHGAAEMVTLAGRVNRLIIAFEASRRDAELRAEQARANVERERNQLAALVSEMPQGVLACNREGRILLYNGHVRELFGGSGEASLIGLGRPVDAVFDRRLLAHARDGLWRKLERQRGRVMVSFVTATVAGRLVRARITPVLDSDATRPITERLNGYLILTEDITRDAEQAARRDRLVELLTQSQRGGLASIRAAAENLLDYDDLDATQQRRFLEVIRNEAVRLSDRVVETAREFSDVLRSNTALEVMHGVDLVGAAQRRIEARTGMLTKLDDVDPDIWVNVDSFAIVQVITVLAQRVHESVEPREVRLAVRGDAGTAVVELSWGGTSLSSESAAGWEMEPMLLAGETSPRSIREVLHRHEGELVYGRERASARSWFRVLLPLAVAGESAAADEAGDGTRPEYYDFDLFAWGEQGRALQDRPLATLAYTVFDTETTGLDPSGGDEIIQIGAIRIVNGRLLRGERFEQLVDPKRDIDPASEAIHGISRERLRGQPEIGVVLPRFHAFARDTVLVGHNAAFDMRFLQMKETVTGLRFDHPVLDTLLLSAVLHPNQETHKLDAIAERFGVPLLDRHDASGDALVTGQLFLRMIPLLAERGIVTLGQAREASEKTYYARIRY
ncbi:exonuclease domain-containing protein [Niveibacterium umoris]|uniref:DNA-directed DNA polymerase n=1 Tax=Niveibacterium umoris TaxID=1193620 RepID=A0A840BDR9_9RHOO|nr:exonuclease domain-containing protein [Niveibacterium umoris]MBB4010843.1 DNA polymerase-3 subunit epsilon [Niveibacterium umoris]